MEDSKGLKRLLRCFWAVQDALNELHLTGANGTNVLRPVLPRLTVTEVVDNGRLDRFLNLKSAQQIEELGLIIGVAFAFAARSMITR